MHEPTLKTRAGRRLAREESGLWTVDTLGLSRERTLVWHQGLSVYPSPSLIMLQRCGEAAERKSPRAAGPASLKLKQKGLGSVADTKKQWFYWGIPNIVRKESVWFRGKGVAEKEPACSVKNPSLDKYCNEYSEWPTQWGWNNRWHLHRRYRDDQTSQERLWDSKKVTSRPRLSPPNPSDLTNVKPLQTYKEIVLTKGRTGLHAEEFKDLYNTGKQCWTQQKKK